MEHPRGASDDGDVVIDLLAQDPPEGGEREREQDPEPRAPIVDPAIEPREAALERTEREEPAPRREARRDDDEPRDPRRRGESEEDFGRRVRGRINRERALRQRSDRRFDEVSAENRELRDRLVKVERRQTASDITEDATKKLSELKAKIDAATAKLKVALEAGDTSAQLTINVELAELIADKKIVERRSEHLAEQARIAAAAPAQEREEGGDPAEARIARATTQWQAANRKWWNLNRFRDIKADAIELDKDLRQEVRDGSLDLEEYSDEYFAELSTRLKENYPDLDVRGLDGEAIEAESDDLDRDARHRDDSRDDRDRPRGRERDPAPRRKTPAGGGMGTRDGRRGGGDSRQLAEQSRVRLGNADYAQMREFGLDPNDKKQVKRFAQERMRTILTEGREETRRGGGR